jgi:hypothetical protein
MTGYVFAGVVVPGVGSGKPELLLLLLPLLPLDALQPSSNAVTISTVQRAMTQVPRLLRLRRSSGINSSPGMKSVKASSRCGQARKPAAVLAPLVPIVT